MAKELRFTDPAFRCEVVLSGTAKALYEAAQPQFERLKVVKSLGLMAYVHDVAMHTRHQHLVGLMRIFNKLCQQPKDKGLPKEFLWSFWVRLCFAQTGHAAMSYDAEKAVLLACHLDADFKAQLRNLLQPVIAKLAACTVCTKSQCLVKASVAGEGSAWFEQLVDGNQWHRLYRWIAALKVVQEARLLPILTGQRASKDNPLGFSEIEAFKLLVAPGCRWDRPVRNLSRLDFIVRDLAFAGTLGVQLDVDNLVAAANADHPDWGLLASLSDYMSKTLYESLSAQTASVLFQRALASMLIAGKIDLEALFGIDLDKALSDDELRDLLQRTVPGRQVVDPIRRASWRAWPINTFIDKKLVPCELERNITGHKKGHLVRHASARATCLKLREDHMLAIAISHESLADRPTATAFVKLCRSVLKHQYPKLVPDQLTNALLEGLIGQHCEHGLNKHTERLSRLGLDLVSLRRAANVVNTRASGKAVVSGDVRFKIGDYEYPFRGDPQELQINTMHAALSGSDTVRSNLGVTQEMASWILWDELLHWQTQYFGIQHTKAVSDLCTEAQEQLAKDVVAGTADASEDLECYCLLLALGYPDAGVSFQVTLPNLRLLNEDGSPENEYDVVSVVLKQDKNVEVWVWGVTTEANLTTKRTADLGKIQKLKDLLGNRWGEDVRVVTCYVHRDGNDICREIDGVQTRVTVATL